MEDSAVVRLARELDGISERNAHDRELVTLCDRLLLYLGEIDRSRPEALDDINAEGVPAKRQTAPRPKR